MDAANFNSAQVGKPTYKTSTADQHYVVCLSRKLHNEELHDFCIPYKTLLA
jgi:hypothetical protein